MNSQTISYVKKIETYMTGDKEAKRLYNTEVKKL